MDQSDVVKKISLLLEADDLNSDLEPAEKVNPRKLVSTAVGDLKFIVSSQAAIKEYSKLIATSDTIQTDTESQKEVLQSFQQLESILHSFQEDSCMVEKLNHEFLVEIDNMEEQSIQQVDHATNLLRARQQQLRQND